MRDADAQETLPAVGEIEDVAHFHGLETRRRVIAADVTGAGERRAQRARSQGCPQPGEVARRLNPHGDVVVRWVARHQHSQAPAFGVREGARVGRLRGYLRGKDCLLYTSDAADE